MPTHLHNAKHQLEGLFALRTDLCTSKIMCIPRTKAAFTDKTWLPTQLHSHSSNTTSSPNSIESNSHVLSLKEET